MPNNSPPPPRCGQEPSVPIDLAWVAILFFLVAWCDSIGCQWFRVWFVGVGASKTSIKNINRCQVYQRRSWTRPLSIELGRCELVSRA